MSTDSVSSSGGESYAETAPACAKQCRGFRWWQLGLYTIPLVIIAGRALTLWLQKPDYVRLLWQDPMGVKMLTAASVLLVVGAVVYLGGCLIINSFVARPKWGTLATVLQMLLVLAWLVLFCAPAVYMLLIGPAAIQIQRNIIAS
jgi:hypothetical protein